eukprot:EG_transcript_30168
MDRELVPFLWKYAEILNSQNRFQRLPTCFPRLPGFPGWPLHASALPPAFGGNKFVRYSFSRGSAPGAAAVLHSGDRGAEVRGTSAHFFALRQAGCFFFEARSIAEHDVVPVFFPAVICFGPYPPTSSRKLSIPEDFQGPTQETVGVPGTDQTGYDVVKIPGTHRPVR